MTSATLSTTAAFKPRRVSASTGWRRSMPVTSAPMCWPSRVTFIAAPPSAREWPPAYGIRLKRQGLTIHLIIGARYPGVHGETDSERRPSSGRGEWIYIIVPSPSNGEPHGRRDPRHPEKPRKGKIRARRSRLVDDRAPRAPHRDRAHGRQRGLRHALRRRRAQRLLLGHHRPDLHGGAGGGHHAVRARADDGPRAHRRGAERRRPRRDRAARPLRRGGAPRGDRRQVSAARRARRGRDRCRTFSSTRFRRPRPIRR